MGGTKMNAPVVGLAPHLTDGYRLVGFDGGIFSFGDAPVRRESRRQPEPAQG
jgi:hypothetical protein